MSEKLKVMTFNIRVEASIDGINYLDNRRGRILDTIAQEKPDLIGFQEVGNKSRAWLRDSLTDYTVVGCGRYKDYRGEGAPLAFRKDRFEMVSMETFWLSCTPKVPESRYDGTDQSGCPRIATAVVLKPIESEKLLLFVNTHTDHMGAVSRILASAQLLEYASQKGMATVFTGDFNALPDTTEIKMMTANKAFPLVDATANIESTFHAFGKLQDYADKFENRPVKIDYIFTNLQTDPDESYAVEDIPVDGIYISDHQPVVAFVEI
ncbi:MAG: endonuclease/exonuclease/phosphatase family protein [Clostridia bacterium]|nr:endonuclease/exonuclease/phosphatase family protein [Clostridia bacterium]